MVYVFLPQNLRALRSRHLDWLIDSVKLKIKHAANVALVVNYFASFGLQ